MSPPVHRFLRPFTRITSSGAVIAEIDGLRFVAIALVVLFHLNGTLLHYRGARFDAPEQSWLAQVGLHGHFGVMLFFVISGFVLALPFARHHLTGAPGVPMRAYFLRRLTRLEPPYVASLVIMTGLILVSTGQSLATLLPHLGASLLYLHNMIFGQMSTINGVAWSLEVEVQFYVLVPLLTRIFAIRSAVMRRSVIVAAMLAASTLNLVPKPEAGRLALSVLYFAQYFLAGFLLADLYIAGWRERPVVRARWDLVSLAGWPLLFWVAQHDLRAAYLFPFVTLALYAAALHGPWSRRFFGSPLIVTIGGMCYTIYLYHYPIVTNAGRPFWGIGESLGYSGYLALQLAIASIPLLLITGALFAFLERPFMIRDWPQKVAKWRRPSVVRRTAGDAGTA